jgi:YHS domain-containing protein
MIRFLIFLILAYIAYRTIKAIFRPKEELSGGQDRGVIDEMVQDPHCKTYVPKREAVKRIIAGEAHFFCSDTCADKFQKQA